MMLVGVFLSCVLLFSSLATCQDVNLEADKQLYAEQITPGSSRVYSLLNLQPNSHYEVRISVAATSGTEFKLELLADIETYHSRDILNTDKFMFTTDSDAHITHWKGRVVPPNGIYKIKVTAIGTGVSPDPNRIKKAIEFNIVLETLFYGAPYGIFKLGVFIAVMCVFVATIVVPQIFPRVAGFKQLVD